jgi:hypothetical protein
MLHPACLCKCTCPVVLIGRWHETWQYRDMDAAQMCGARGVLFAEWCELPCLAAVPLFPNAHTLSRLLPPPPTPHPILLAHTPPTCPPPSPAGVPPRGVPPPAAPAGGPGSRTGSSSRGGRSCSRRCRQLWRCTSRGCCSCCEGDSSSCCSRGVGDPAGAVGHCVDTQLAAPVCAGGQVRGRVIQGGVAVAFESAACVGVGTPELLGGQEPCTLPGIRQLAAVVPTGPAHPAR